ncbi:MAG TPA: XRE family transcriptional regulator [Streptosporangiaceae bacterium]|nr:XRE family transcriptional regulator [Streptosporangiaceae bacterium]
MSAPYDPVLAARRRRALGTVDTFSGARLGIARRMARLPRTELAARVGISPAAITQLERDLIRPTTGLAAELSLALGVPGCFLLHAVSPQPIPASAAHFRSLRSTPAMSRDQALAFAELSLEVLAAIEDYVDLPETSLPEVDLSSLHTAEGVASSAAQARAGLGVAEGPVPHVVRLLEAHGVLVLRLPDELVDRRVDAFSTTAGRRPVVLLSPMKDDKARSRFDGAHELGHLLLHHDAEPGSKVIENQAHAFAAAFLTPADQVAEDLPRRLDWPAFHRAKRRWGVSLKALIYRAHSLKLLSDAAYRRANVQLAEWGNPEPGPLGPPESPSLLGTAIAMLEDTGVTIDDIAEHGSVPASRVRDIVDAATDLRPRV